MKNAFEYEAELAALREELAALREELAKKDGRGLTQIVKDNAALQQRLADAERRNSESADLLRYAHNTGVMSGWRGAQYTEIKPATAAEFLAEYPVQEMSAYDAVMSDAWMPPEGISAETVYSTLSKDPNKSRRTSPENVSDVLETLRQVRALKPTESGASE